MTKKLPLVSVITPTYNRAYILPTAIKSVLNQTYPNFEHIIVNDGSIDQTEKVIKKYYDPRIRYIHLAKNGGLAKARNTALLAAKGDWITYIGDDKKCPKEKGTYICHSPGQEDFGALSEWKAG